MNQNRLVRQLQREASKNPVKAGFLGLMCLVAVVKWTPLVCGWISPSTTTGPVAATAVVPPPAAATPVATSATPATASTTTTAAAAPTAGPAVPTSWKQLVAWMESDPHMKPATALNASRDPFRLRPEDDPAYLLAEPEPEPAEDLITPATAGLTLSSTIVGSRRKVALIGGRAYAEGRVIVARSGGQVVTFQLVEVHPRHVVLERVGRRYELKIPATGMSAGLFVERQEQAPAPL